MLVTPDVACETGLSERLGTLLPGWLSSVPLYRRSAQLAGMANPESDCLATLQQLPFITKEDLRRDFPRNFLPSGVELEDLLNEERVELEHTSGTSEERTSLLLESGWWGRQEERALRLNPRVASILDEYPEARRVTINSPSCSGDICYSGVPSQAERVVGSTLFVSLSRFPFMWSEADLARMAAETLGWKPQFLDVDPVYGVVFALYCERQGIRLPSVHFVLSSYEYVSVNHRRILERVFGVPVFNLYGSTETGHLLMESGGGELKPSCETAFLELLAQREDGVGELVVTTLTNKYMPLLRYRIGDLAERRERAHQATYVVHGRVADAFARPDNRLVPISHIDRCFSGLAGVAHYQLRQLPEGEWLLRYIAEGSPPEPEGLRQLEARLRDQLHARGRFEIERTDLLLPEGSGKFRLGYPLR